MQERTVSAMLAELRALPGWDDTVVVFVSDHGEEFREHGGMYHLTTLFDEQVRIPGWLLAGPRVLEPSQRDALAAWVNRRTFTRDMNATILDLLGVLDARPGFPFADGCSGARCCVHRLAGTRRCRCRRPAASGSRTSRSTASCRAICWRCDRRRRAGSATTRSGSERAHARQGLRLPGAHRARDADVRGLAE